MNHEILYTKAINFLLYKIPLKTIVLKTTVLKIFNTTMNIYIHRLSKIYNSVTRKHHYSLGFSTQLYSKCI